MQWHGLTYQLEPDPTTTTTTTTPTTGAAEEEERGEELEDSTSRMISVRELYYNYDY